LHRKIIAEDRIIYHIATMQIRLKHTSTDEVACRKAVEAIRDLARHKEFQRAVCFLSSALFAGFPR
jgi:hypothetical protein